MITPLQQAAQAAIANSDEFYALYKRTVTSGCIPVCELKFVAAQKELRKALDAELQQAVEPEVLMVDAAMAEMKNIVPPLRRSECLRLIRAAINATAHPPQPQATTAVVTGLLKSFQKVMSWIDNWSPEFSNDPDWPIDRDAARAAIAKAQGEKP